MRAVIAILCSGQGGQHAGMFDLVSECIEAKPVFAAATAVLGQDPRDLVHKATAAELFSNRIGQILCCTQALAVWAALGPDRPKQAVFAGYSVGELAAWGCSGIFDAAGTLRVAQRRAEVMDAAAPQDGGLAGIVGLRRPILEEILTRHEAFIAIINGIDSFVVGGLRPALNIICREAEQSGAQRAVMLQVAVPSHTPLLAAATPAFRTVLQDAAPTLPPQQYRVLSGIDGDTIRDIGMGIEKFARQISSPVDWASCLESCRAAGAAGALELGPGAALSHMALDLFPDGTARSAQDFRTVPGLRAWLRRTLDSG